MKITKFKTLRFQIRLVSALLLFILIVLLGISIKRAFDANKQTEEYLIINKISGLLNVATGWQALERGYGATIIGGGKGDSSPFFPKFIEMTKTGDSGVFQIEKEAEKLLGVRSNKTFEKKIIKWRKSYKSLVSARQKIASNDISNDEWLNIATFNIRSEFNLRNTAFTPLKANEKIIYLNYVLRPNIAILCEYAGLERALVSNTIESGTPLSHETINRIKRYRSIVDQSLDQILALKESPSTSIRMKQAIDIFEKEFLQSYQFLKEEVFSSSEKLDEDIKRVKEDIVNRNVIFHNYLHGAKNDLLNISKNQEVIAFARSMSLSSEEDTRLPEQLSAVENLFNNFSQVKRVYGQIRFLDNIGYERVRVDFDGNVTNIIRGEKLQDKSERYYFKKSINMPQGSIYISPLDLNVEHGRIKLPYTPVLRYTTPVFVDGKRAGIIVFNLLADTPSFLHKITGNEGETDYILANQDGFYLHHTDKVKEWGMMELLNRSHQNIRQDYPDIAELILSGSEGSVRLDSGQVIVYRSFFFDPGTSTGNFWIIVKRVKGVDYPVSASVWFDEATKAINKGLAISNIAGEEANAIMIKMEATAKRSMLISYIILGFTIFVFIYFTRWSRNRVLKPIQRLTDVSQRIAEGDLSHRADVKQGDEIGTMANNFNIMADELTNDITMRKQAEKRLSAQYYVTKVLAEAANTKEASSKILQAVCTALEWDLGEIWEFDRQDCVLRCSEIWHIPSIKVSEFKKLTRQTSFAKGIGLPGRVFESARPAWIADVVQDTNFPRASVAAENGLHGAFGFPVISDNEVLGVISFYSREIRTPDTDLLNMLLSIGSQIGLFIKRKRSEEKIASFVNILEETLNEIYIFDAKTLRFLEVNKGARLNLGYSMGELSNLTPLDLQPKFTLESFQKMIETLQVGEKRKVDFSTIHRRKNGSFYDVEVHLQLSSFQSVPAFVAIILDITERKKMEAALLQSEKLKSVGLVASGISHEINNILAIIMGRAEILQRGFNDSKLKEGLSSIIKAGENGAEIVSKMLTFAKSDAKTSDYVFIDIGLLICQSIDFTEPRWKNMAQSKGINYQIDTAGIDKIHEVFCNSTELTEVFINIINNALDAMPEGGCLAFSVKSDKNTVFINISDTGTGMSDDDRKTIFDPFFTTRLPHGTGLGMSIVYSIIKRHGGKIEVESEIGKGTTFNLSIPIHKEMIQNIAPLSEPDSDRITKKLRILVVDDEKDICNIIDDFLTADGHIIKTVNSGAEAIEQIRKEQFDLVLSDLAMPDKTGYDVITALNKLEKRPKIGIITGWSEELNSLEKETMKVDFIMKKPLHLSEIARRINDTFTKND